MECPNCGSDDIAKRDGVDGWASLECIPCELQGFSNPGGVRWNEPKAQRAYDAALRDERDVFDEWKRDV